MDVDDSTYAPLINHPLILSAAKHVLGGATRSDAVVARVCVPGAGHQGFHNDFDDPRQPNKWDRFAATWVLSPFTSESGTLRIIPGSHITGAPAHDEDDYGWALPPHPDETKVIAEPGSLILWNRHVWYSWTFNGSRERSISMTIGFKRSD